MSTSNFEKCALAFLGGAAVGVTLGILFAPDKGSNTRKKIAKSTHDFTGDITDKLENLADSAKGIIEDLKTSTFNRTSESEQEL